VPESLASIETVMVINHATNRIVPQWLSYLICNYTNNFRFRIYECGSRRHTVV